MQQFKNAMLVGLMSVCTLGFFSCHAQKKVSDIKKKTITENKLETSQSDERFQSEKNLKGASIPQFSFITAQGKEMHTKDFPKDKPVLLILFNPSCGHCQVLLEQIRDNINDFNFATILFLTGKPLKDVLSNYVVNVKVDKLQDEILVASDNSDATLKIFEYEGIPQVMIYNKEHKLEFIYYKEAQNMNMLRYLKK